MCIDYTGRQIDQPNDGHPATDKAGNKLGLSKNFSETKVMTPGKGIRPMTIQVDRMVS